MKQEDENSMLGHDEHELDVDFEIIEDPEDSAFPRLPNVVSHRRHRVKIIATVHDLPFPDRTTKITLSAIVNVLHYELISEKGHVARPFERWGTSNKVTATFTPDEYSGFPFNIEAIVPRSGDDDHLGQGPDYEALIEVKTTSVEPLIEGDDGEAEPRHAAEPDDDTFTTEPITEGSFIVRFTAK
jgi:hypothetical protein